PAHDLDDQVLGGGETSWLPTGGFRRWACSSIHREKLNALNGMASFQRCPKGLPARVVKVVRGPVTLAPPMCGIAGYFALTPRPLAPQGVLERMVEAVRHRGPHAGGVYHDGRAALGHRRLSIIDLSGGKQPLSTAD